jgi:hypothetical protein
MNYTKYFPAAIPSTATLFNLSAQNAPQDSILLKKLPVQAFAAMPVLLGIGTENAFRRDRLSPQCHH